MFCGCKKFETIVVNKKHLKDVPKEDYQRFVRPYENKRRFKPNE